MGSLERTFARRFRRKARRPRGGDARNLSDVQGGQPLPASITPDEAALKAVRMMRRAKARG